MGLIGSASKGKGKEGGKGAPCVRAACNGAQGWAAAVAKKKMERWRRRRANMPSWVGEQIDGRKQQGKGSVATIHGMVFFGGGVLGGCLGGRVGGCDEQWGLGVFANRRGGNGGCIDFAAGNISKARHVKLGSFWSQERAQDGNNVCCAPHKKGGRGTERPRRAPAGHDDSRHTSPHSSAPPSPAATSAQRAAALSSAATLASAICVWCLLLCLCGKGML